MKTSELSKLLITLAFIAAAFFASAQYTQEIKNFNGLNTATFKTDEGNINVYFPDLQAGDIISGTVLSEPSGKNERQKDRNSNVISGYVVEIENDNSEEDKIDVKDKLFRWEIPAVVATGLKLVLKGPGGKVLGSGEIPVITNSPYMEIPSVITEDNFAVPDFIQSGSNTSVGGFFDGDFSTTNLNIGGEDVDILAESPRGIFFESPHNITGATDIKLTEGDIEVQARATAFNLSLTADKLTLQKGDKTTVHVRIDGLKGLDREIPVEITNLTENTVTVEGGDQQSVMITPGDITPAGTFTTDIPVTAISSGAFSVAVNVKPPHPVIINKIYPSDVTESREPNFIWSAINAPPDCEYSLKLWDIKTFENISEAESFEFDPEILDRAEPIIDAGGLTETSFSFSEVADIQLEPGHIYGWQVSVMSGMQPQIKPPVWLFSVNGSDVSRDYIHIRTGEYSSKYFPSGWRHIRTGAYSSKIYNPATHRHLTSREYNTKIYSTADYRHITRDKDKTKIYPSNLRHIASGDNESYLYNPDEYKPHVTTGSRASVLIPNGFNHLLNEADRTKIYPESDRHLSSGDNNTKIVPGSHEYLTMAPFNTKIYPKSSRHINWGTTNVSRLIPEGMVHIDSGEDFSKLHSEADRHLKGGRDNSKVVPAGNEHVSSGENQSKIYPEGNNHIRTGTNASGIYNPETEKHITMGNNQTKVIPKDNYHISSGAVQTKYGPGGARHISEGELATKLHTRSGANIDPSDAENPSGNASEAGRPADSKTPDGNAVKPEREAGTPSQQPEAPGEPVEPKELDEW